MEIRRSWSKTTSSPIRIDPVSGCSRPATQRSSVVLRLPEAPSSETMEPRSAVKEAPFRM
jgi:hypothetical protein